MTRATEELQSFDDLFQPDTAFPYFEEVFIWPTDVTADSWSPTRAAILAQLSTLVYVPDATLVRTEAAKGGFLKATFVEGGDSQVWVFESEVIRAIVFRGTEPGNTQDLLTDLNLLSTGSIEGIQAHSGFVEALKRVTPELDAILAQADAKPLWLAGHSLGGALAQLYAWHLRGDRVAGVIVMGSPRVLLAVDHERLTDDFPCFRVVNNNDVVPHLPTPPLYAHIGEEWFIDESGQLHLEPTLKAKLSAAWQGHRDYAARWFAQWQDTQDIRLVPGAAIADHAPSAYARALILAAQVP